MQWTGENYDEIKRFITISNSPRTQDEVSLDVYLNLLFWIEKGSTWTKLPIGGWVVKEPDNIGVYPITQEQFAKEYKEYNNWGDYGDENGYA